MGRWILGLLGAFSLNVTAYAGPEDFKAGQIIENYGQIATIEQDNPISKRSRFKVAFDIASAGEAGEVNRGIDSLARFINMHAEAGISPNRIKLAMVIHGRASKDFTNDNFYGETYDGASNANKALIEALQNQGVKFYLCGQSAAYHDIEKADLLPGIEMALSAMTMHALLQQDGYTLNPF